MTNVAVFVGSLRRESLNRQLALALARLAEPRGLTLVQARLDDLPLYNEDLWEAPPASVQRLKAEIAAADALLFVTPEYNRSLPAVTKNVIDWGSRPSGQNSWGGKPTGILGTSPGAIGTAVAQSHLRSIAPVLGMRMISQPEVYLTFKPGLIDESHAVTDEAARKLLERYLEAFAAWIARAGGK